MASSSASGSDAATPAPSTTSLPATTTTTAPPTTAQPRLPDDPAELARQLVADERVVRDAGTAPDALHAAARRLQLAYRRIGRHPEWDATIAPLVPADLATAVTTGIDARRHLTALGAATPLRDSLPAWRIVAPAPEADLLAYYREGESRYGVGWSYLAAVNLVETGFGQIVGLSTAGAQGPMQFLPSTWDAYGAGGDIDSPHDSIVGAARYLAANGFADDVDGALRRYNHSDDYVAAVKDYAAILAAEPGLYRSFHEWAVYYLTTAGDVLLPVGYESAERVPVADWLASHPQ